jgi:hypothetical protein
MAYMATLRCFPLAVSSTERVLASTRKVTPILSLAELVEGGLTCALHREHFHRRYVFPPSWFLVCVARVEKQGAVHEKLHPSPAYMSKQEVLPIPVPIRHRVAELFLSAPSE